MTPIWWIVGIGSTVAAAFGAVRLARRLRKNHRSAQLVAARKAFHPRREVLELKFVEMASANAPRGLQWADCEFDNDVAYARDPQSGELVAFVSVTIQFRAIEGGGMEEVEAVSNLRAATAVFHYRKGQWRTEGRTIMNMGPDVAIDRFRLEMVARDVAGQV